MQSHWLIFIYTWVVKTWNHSESQKELEIIQIKLQLTERTSLRSVTTLKCSSVWHSAIAKKFKISPSSHGWSGQFNAQLWSIFEVWQKWKEKLRWFRQSFSDGQHSHFISLRLLLHSPVNGLHCMNGELVSQGLNGIKTMLWHNSIIWSKHARFVTRNWLKTEISFVSTLLSLSRARSFALHEVNKCLWTCCTAPDNCCISLSFFAIPRRFRSSLNWFILSITGEKMFSILLRTGEGSNEGNLFV